MADPDIMITGNGPVKNNAVCKYQELHWIPTTGWIQVAIYHIIYLTIPFNTGYLPGVEPKRHCSICHTPF